MDGVGRVVESGTCRALSRQRGVLLRDLKAVFVGDALFRGASVARTSPGEHPGVGTLDGEQLYSLPDNTVVYPGHGPDTLIGVERETNPMFTVSEAAPISKVNESQT